MGSRVAAGGFAAVEEGGKMRGRGSGVGRRARRVGAAPPDQRRVATMWNSSPDATSAR